MAKTVLTSAPPTEALNAVEAFVARRGIYRITVVTRTPVSVVLERRGAPSMGITLALAVLFLVPGLLYYAFGPGVRKKTTVTAVEHGEGSQVTYSSEDWYARVFMGELLDSLPDARKPGSQNDLSHLRDKGRDGHPAPWRQGFDAARRNEKRNEPPDTS